MRLEQHSNSPQALRNTKSSRLVRLAVTAALSGAASLATQAQEAPQSDDGLSEIVVTGSRIARRDYTSDSPIVTVTGEMLQNTSEVGVDQTLSQMPQFVASQNQYSSATGTQSTPTSSPGISTVNLRGLGSNRTLVLLDGRRTQPANASMSVDLNTIPSAAIDTIEVITGGAGATYGADAVAGVVNFKLKRNFNGVAIDAQSGQTAASDGKQSSASLLVGSNFADNRGNAMIGVSYAQRDEILRDSRPFFAAAFTDPDTAGGTYPFTGGYYAGNNAGLSQVLVGTSTSTPATTANTPYYTNTSLSFNASGSPSQAAIDSVFGPKGYVAGDVKGSAYWFNQAATTSGASLFTMGPSVAGKSAPGFTGTVSPNYKLMRNGTLAANTLGSYLQLPMTRYSTYANLRYKLNDSVEAYLQTSFNETVTKTQTGTLTAFNQWSVTVPYDSAHPVPTELKTLLDSRGANATNAWTLQQNLGFMGNESLETTTHTYEMLVGLRGKLGISDWTYDAFASRGSTTQLVQYTGFVDWTAWQALVNKPNYGVNAEYNLPKLGVMAHCTSGVNPFLNSAVSQDCKDILDPKAKTSSALTQQQAEVNLQGSLFVLPAGELRAAIGADYRKAIYSYEPDHAFASTNIVSDTAGLFDTTATYGEMAVKEAYGEILAPVLKDKPFVKSFTVSGGFRYSDYSTTGGVSTWKLTADWDVNDWIRFRGGRQVANRAPNVAELFQPTIYQTVNWSDHDPCSNVTHAYTWGNSAQNTTNRAQVLALCTALSGGFPITTSFVGNQSVYFALGRDAQKGNPALQPEGAKTWTFGTVLRSPFEAEALRRLTLSVDYYSIKISDAVTNLTTGEVYRQCFNQYGGNPNFDPNNMYCKLINRDQLTGFWLSTTAPFANLSTQNTSGIDVSLDWRMDTPFIGGRTGIIAVNLNANWLESFDVQYSSQQAAISYKDTIGSGYGAEYRYKLMSNFSYAVGPVSATLGWRHLPSINNATSTSLPTASYDLFNLSARYAVNSTISLRAGIDNLFGREPNRVGGTAVKDASGTIIGYNNAGSTDSSNYDIAGRRFYLGVSARL
jgi:outer membrane receptor protein involved in Fe transport